MAGHWHRGGDFTHLAWAGALSQGAMPGQSGRLGAARPPARVWPPGSQPMQGHRPKIAAPPNLRTCARAAATLHPQRLNQAEQACGKDHERISWYILTMLLQQPFPSTITAPIG
jgi:hypothetical protein